MRNDVVIKGAGETSAPTAVADGAEVNQWLDEYGREVVVPKGTDGAELTPNVEFTILASAARTTAQSEVQVNTHHKGVIIFVDWTSETATVTLTPSIQMNPVIGTAKTIWTATAPLTAIGQTVYLFHPSAVDAASYTEAVETVIPLDWTFVMAVADTDSATYSVTAVYI